ncbi:MAG: GNAT family N-acetyltransferase [Acidobacteriales bacterium]|nr:GNAT family N-acetyltransferase [Terriglobales bacterium]
MPLPNVSFRPATPQDCAVILHHRRSMFQDMGEGTAKELDRMIEATAPWLARALADGSYQGWLAEDLQGSVVAGGGVLISSWPAGPRDPYTRRALIINVYTEPEVRQQGLARQLMLLMIQWLREQGLYSVVLHASDAGRHLYETLGFVPTNEMRLRLK